MKRRNEWIGGVLCFLLGAAVLLGPFFATGHEPSKYEIGAALLLVLIGLWFLDPVGFGERLDTVRNTVPFLQDSHSHGDDDA